MRRLTRRQWAAVLIGVALAGVLRGCILRPATDYPGRHFNQGDNGIWLGVEWVNETHSAPAITALGEALLDHQIRHVYVYTSYLRADGTFNDSYEYASGFLAKLKQAYPDMLVYAWIGLPLAATGMSDSYHVNLGDEATRRRIVDFSASLTHDLGFDGVHLDPEPVHSGDTDLLRLLDEMRAALDADALLSLAGRRIWPVFPAAPWPLIGAVAWRADYYRDVAERVDQIAVMVYDSRQPTAWLYRKWVQFEVISLSCTLSDAQIDLLIGIPTSEEQTSTHNPAAETMQSGLQGTITGLNDRAACPDAVTGVAIYPAWDTDAAEWRVYERLWLGR